MNTINGTISLAKVRQTYIRVLFSPGVAQNINLPSKKKRIQMKQTCLKLPQKLTKRPYVYVTWICLRWFKSSKKKNLLPSGGVS